MIARTSCPPVRFQSKRYNPFYTVPTARTDELMCYETITTTSGDSGVAVAVRNQEIWKQTIQTRARFWQETHRNVPELETSMRGAAEVFHKIVIRCKTIDATKSSQLVTRQAVHSKHVTKTRTCAKVPHLYRIRSIIASDGCHFNRLFIFHFEFQLCFCGDRKWRQIIQHISYSDAHSREGKSYVMLHVVRMLPPFEQIAKTPIGQGYRKFGNGYPLAGWYPHKNELLFCFALMTMVRAKCTTNSCSCRGLVVMSCDSHSRGRGF